MNDYPVWWDSTITVYNKFTDSDRVIHWIKTVIDNCFWKIGTGQSMNNTVTDTTTTVVCRIPKQSDYVNPVEWKLNANPSSGFTLQPDDIIVKGSVDDDINEYQSGHRASDLLAKYSALHNCMKIIQVEDGTLTGMVNPHYCVRGK